MSWQPHKMGSSIPPFYRWGNRGLIEVKYFAKSHTASKWSSRLGLEPVFLLFQCDIVWGVPKTTPWLTDSLGEFTGQPGAHFPESFPSAVTWVMLNSSSNNCDHTCEILSARATHQRHSALGFYWGWSCRHPLPSTYRNSRLSEGKQVLSINPVSPSEPHSYQFWEWWEPPWNPRS